MQMRNIKVWICLLMSFFTYPLTPPGRPKGPLWYLHDWRLWSTCLEIEVQISPDHDPLSLSWSRKRCPNMSREKLLPGLNPGHCQLFEIHTFYIPIVRLHLRFYCLVRIIITLSGDQICARSQAKAPRNKWAIIHEKQTLVKATTGMVKFYDNCDWMLFVNYFTPLAQCLDDYISVRSTDTNHKLQSLETNRAPIHKTFRKK